MVKFYRMPSGRMRMVRNGGSRGSFKSTSARPKFRFAPRMGRRFWGPRPSVVRTFPHLELKFFDLDIDQSPVAVGGNITDSVNEIAQGVTETTRIGRKCTIKSINWRFKISLPASTTSASTSDVIRVMLYLDKQANGATAAVADILESADFQSFNNLSNKSRFRTIMDRTYDLNVPSGGGDGTTEDYGEVTETDTLFKKVNVPIEFNSTAGAITELTSNNFGVLLISASGLATFSSKMRLRYSDI